MAQKDFIFGWHHFLEVEGKVTGHFRNLQQQCLHDKPFNLMDHWIKLFIYAGEILVHTMDILYHWVRNIPGGITH